MELRDMEYFSVVAERGHLGRAADALGMSQSALSKCLRRIEVSVGTKIVVRTAKGVELTAAGTALLSHVSKLRLAHEDINREITDLEQGRAGHVRIGITPGLGEELIGPACSSLLNEAPKATLKVKVLTPDELLDGVAKGELDLALTNTSATPPENLVHEQLLNDEFVIYASLNHPLARRKKLTLGDIAREKWTAHIGSYSWETLRQAFTERKLIPPRISLESDSLSVRFNAITSSGRLGFTSRQVVRHAAPRFRFAELRVNDFAYARHLGLFYRQHAYLSPATQRFIEILKVVTKEIAAE